jgi:predicted transcriptional regulator
MPKPKGATSFRLSEDAQGLLQQLSEQLGVSKTAVLELAVRRLARDELPSPGGGKGKAKGNRRAEEP